MTTEDKAPSPSPDINRPSSGRKLSAEKRRTPIAVKTYEMSIHQPFPPPTTPASVPESRDKTSRFAIQHGKVVDTRQEFLSFKQHYCLSWGSIVTMLKHLERMLTNYSVPIAFINGEKLADLALEFELEKPPTVQDLLTVIVNREDVENIIRRPGRRFMGPNGLHVAATIIQAMYRRYRDRVNYLDYRRKKWAAGVIALSWIMHIKMGQVRTQLKQARTEQLDAFRRRSLEFAKRWSHIRSQRRVVIHMPSLGYSLNIRDKMTDMAICQNTQMARLCDIRDINDQSHFPAASPGFAHRCFRKTGASTMPRVNGLKIAIEIH
ncbi:hypothetical protein NP493_102g04042 [Ridgeia piscesae]|uniref:Uncharacterized protein n=1 Tax=Ridgeia piscesae TaxID=27915 RepID=A0AAD9UHE5_RIDPI|nr:hypothetical protein NP493_102g04042 [Ridgeia piscesae]